MRTRACIAAAVTETDEFLSLTLEAQTLYIHLLLNADVSGRILGARRLARGYGLEDALGDLLSAGYLLDVDGSIFDRFAWVNNRYTAQSFSRMADCEEYQSGCLYFTGTEGKSAYATTVTHPNDSGLTIDCQRTDDAFDTIQDNSTAIATQGNTPSFLGKTALANEGTEGEDTHPCLCPRCKEPASYTMADGTCTITCPSCGEFENNH